MAVKPEKRAAPRPRRAKAEVQEEFEAIQAEVAADTGDAKSRVIANGYDQQVREAVEGVGVEAVIQRVAGLGLDVSRSLAGISEQLTAEVGLLESLRQAVAIERREIERLHKIDVAATALDQMVADYEQRRQTLEAEITAQREGWLVDAQRVDRERREQDEALKKQRSREIEDYEYKKALERKKAQDKYEEDVRQAERKNIERQAALEKDWQLREADLKAREDELRDLQEEVDGFPARVSSAVEGASNETRLQVEAQFERQMLILKKDAEAETRVAQLTIKSLEGALAASAAQIASLERQLTQAKQQVQDIAVRAIEGASGARALGHINEIAMEQAKNRPQG